MNPVSQGLPVPAITIPPSCLVLPRVEIAPMTADRPMIGIFCHLGARSTRELVSRVPRPARPEGERRGLLEPPGLLIEAR